MNQNLKIKLGLRIKELRVANHLTQEHMAELVGMERTNITRIEAGKHFPNAENLGKLAKVLNVSPKELFDLEHHKSKEELIKEIDTIIANYDLKKVQFVYKSVVNLKNL